MTKRNTQQSPTPAAAEPATTGPAAPDLTAMLESIQDPATRARLQSDLAAQLAFAATRETLAREHEARGEALKAKLESLLTTEDLQRDSFNVLISGATGQVTVEVWPDPEPAPSRSSTWTDARKQELADLLRQGLTKAQAAERLGMSVSSVGNVIYTCGRNVKGFLERHPEQAAK